MGTPTSWNAQDSMNAYLDGMVEVGTLLDERRFGLFAIPEQTYRAMNEIDLAGLFTRVIPMEMRPMQYDLECGDKINVLECLGVSKLFRQLDVDEEPPIYPLRTLNIGGENG